MPEHTPTSRIISRSYVVRMRSRCASSSLPCSSSHASRSTSSVSMPSIAFTSGPRR